MGPVDFLSPQNFTFIYATRLNDVIDYAYPLEVQIDFEFPIPILENSVILLDVPLTQFLQNLDTISCTL